MALTHSQHRIARGGFSFAEVLFAVAVLGIGFIMVAAIFPVAIQQTQYALEETVGTTVSRNGMSLMDANPLLRKDITPLVGPATTFIDPTFTPPAPPPGAPAPGPQIWSFRDPRLPDDARRAALWNSVCANLIDADDNRFAYIPMYSREQNSSFIRVITIAVRCRNTSEFVKERDARPLAPSGNPVPPVELGPTPVAVTLEYKQPGGSNVMTIDTLTTTDSGDAEFRAMSSAGAARTGAFVIISDDHLPDLPGTPFKNETGSANGRIYRLGQNVGGNVWEIAPDFDMGSANEDLWKGSTSTKAIAFVVGAGFADPTNTANGYGGANRAVQIFDNIIALKD